MKETLTLGSLFDGSGGFPLAGILAGIKPVWASEINPFCVLVTHKHLPEVKHYGDINDLSGAELEPADIITFGSPCQDLSIAGRRAGINAPRSGLFFQATRIIKEMRNATNGKYPRFIVWENVSSCQSSSGGEDFRAVLEEICKVKNGEISIPRPDGKWTRSGEIVDSDFSLAWRTLDAQYWGVPQRRARIYLVADFAGQSAGKILFDREGLSGYSPPSYCPWQRTAGNPEDRSGETDRSTFCLNPQGSSGIAITENQTGTLISQDHGHHPAVLQAAGFCTEHSADSRGIGYEEEKSPTIRAGIVPAAVLYDNHANHEKQEKGSTAIVSDDSLPEQNVRAEEAKSELVPDSITVELMIPTILMSTPEPITLKIRCGKPGGGKGPLLQVNKSATLGSHQDQTLFQPVKDTQSVGYDQFNNAITGSIASTLRTTGAGNQAVTVFQPVGFDRFNGAPTGDVAHTLNAGAGDNTPMVFQDQTHPRTIGADQHYGAVTGDVAHTLAAAAGDKTPAVLQPTAISLSRVAYNGGEKANFGFAVNEEVAPTIEASGPPAVAKPEIKAYGVCSKHSFSMESDNPKAGFYEAKTSRTLDQKCCNPTCGQGGIAIAAPAYSLQGNMIGREEKNGPRGSGVDEEVSFTLNTADRHGVCCATTGSNMAISEDKANALCARDWKAPQIVCNYVVRRLTPLECSRLQGFPDWWCDDLAISDPSPEELAFWKDVWETWRKATNPGGKPKTENQIRKWLANPCTDSEVYKMWGNGVSLPVAFFVLNSIVWAYNNDIS